MSSSVEAVCIVCSGEFGSKQKAGEISIRLTVKGGPSIIVAGPVCPACARASAAAPDTAIEQMRRARNNLLAGALEVPS